MGITKKHAMPAVPAVYRPHGVALAMQPKMAAPAFRGPGIARLPPVPPPFRPGPRAVLQRAKREITAQEHNYVVVPNQDDWYEKHARQRISHFVTVILQVWHVFHEMKKSHAPNALRRMSSTVSPTAEAQVGQGNYGASAGKLDAAHLMNTSVRSDVMLQGMTVTSSQEEMIKALRTMSGATTMQLKADNVGPEKVIDSCMTSFAQLWCAQCDAGNAPPSAESMVAALTHECLTRLNASAKSANVNYQSAIAGVNWAASNAASNVAHEIGPWTKQFGQ